MEGLSGAVELRCMLGRYLNQVDQDFSGARLPCSCFGTDSCSAQT